MASWKLLMLLPVIFVAGGDADFVGGSSAPAHGRVPTLVVDPPMPQDFQMFNDTSLSDDHIQGRKLQAADGTSCTLCAAGSCAAHTTSENYLGIDVCSTCITGAFHDSDSDCKCLDSYSASDDETECVYSASGCRSECDPDGVPICTGPNLGDCTAYVTNASSTGCDSGWSGSDCTTYNGLCTDPLCLDCSDDPATCNDDECVSGAVFDTTCGCDNQHIGRTSTDCSIYIGECADGCARCSSLTNCLECVAHASFSSFTASALGGVCACDPGWSGDMCDTYSASSGSGCHYLCDADYGCYGPTAADCDRCVNHASWVPEQACACDQGWGGFQCERYIDTCDTRCIRCTGSRANDCAYCVENAVRNAYGFCTCEPYWTGEACEIYIGPCDTKCTTCMGPDACDCYDCVQHAYKDENEECQCDPQWCGEACTVFSDYEGECCPLCGTCCHGPYATDCIDCAENAYMNIYGACVCKPGFYGEDCNLTAGYVGRCWHTCDKCSGPYATDCFECVDNADLDLYGACQCKPGYCGYGCGVDFHAPRECDLKCHGCTGHDACDCIACVTHASWNHMRECVCDPGWSGENCTIFIGTCHPLCVTCDGPTYHDCLQCVAHATHSELTQQCTCDVNWLGHACDIYYGMCHPKCNPHLGCRGPGCDDCIGYLPHVRTCEGCDCECEPNYSSLQCAVYTGGCDELCADGCVGPTSADCNLCAANADWNDNGRCICNEDYTGDLCELYCGHCDHRCGSCHGPGAHQCDYCVDNAHWEIDGSCGCDAYWSGEGCRNYVGPCAAICLSCHGPHEGQCSACVANAIHTVLSGSSSCECKPGYRGDACEIWHGECHEYCDHSLGCPLGPESQNCVGCAERSYRDRYTGGCICEDDYFGWECSQYKGVCHDRVPRCKVCVGAYEGDCIECVEHAYLYWLPTHDINAYGQVTVDMSYCVCEDGWSGELCDSYNDACDDICNFCYGPTDYDCMECVENAHRNEWGQCVCNNYWSGSDCTTFDEDYCSPVCDGCTGPEDTDCKECVQNAARRERSGFQLSSTDSSAHDEWNFNYEERPHCVCKDGWTGYDCSLYRGMEANFAYTRHQGRSLGGYPDYVKFNLPEEMDKPIDPVLAAIGEDLNNWLLDWAETNPDNANVFFEETGVHLLNAVQEREAPEASNRVAETSELQVDFRYSGCPSTCKTCVGGFDEDCDVECISCVTNASPDGSDGCTCDSGWIGRTCDYWNGPCDSLCHTCVGPTTYDCITCSYGAARGEGGHCECLPGRYTIDTEFPCGGTTQCEEHCQACTWNFDQYRCDTCVTNAGRGTNGKCECFEDYLGKNCELYAGHCPQTCLSCETWDNCLTCVENATNVAGACTCDSDWTVLPDCSQYSGDCDSLCDLCTGPTASDCVKCVTNAVDVAGMCMCQLDWSGTTCSTYVGMCNPICPSSCTGPSLEDCTVCVDTAFRSLETGLCECLPEYSGPDCSGYTGACPPRCRHCTSIHDCCECIDNAVLYDTRFDSITDYEATDPVHQQCICDEEWGGSECQHYTGDCWPTCLTCWGPAANQCTKCRQNAYRDQTQFGVCVCEDEWSGQDHCDGYIGPCHYTCSNANGCNGPNRKDCKKCATNAYRDLYGNCVCHENWQGDECQLYSGPCETDCVTCSGPGNNCITCVRNAHLEQNFLTHGQVTTDLREERCVCDTDYAGQECAQYVGTCDPKCAHGCHGPLAIHCHFCVENASRDNTNPDNNVGCECSGSWTGDDCSIPGVQCHSSCATCVGPEEYECTSCHMGSALTRTYSPAQLSWVSIHTENGYDETDGVLAMCKPCPTGCKTCYWMRDGLYSVQDLIEEPSANELFPMIEDIGSTDLLNDQCTSCYAGWYYSQTTLVLKEWRGSTPDAYSYNEHYGTCEPCHCSCSACTGPGAHECLYCYDDRELVSDTVDGVAGDYCMCKAGTISDNFFTCLPSCPLGLVAGDINICDSTGSYNISPDKCYRDDHWSCLQNNNITPLENAPDGSYYNGVSASVGEGDHRLPYSQMHTYIPFRPQSTDSVIFSIRDVEFISPDAQRVSNLDAHKAKYTGIIELRITPCGRLMFTFGNTVTTFATRLKLGHWYAHSFSHPSDKMALYIDQDSSATEEILSLGIPDKIFNRDVVDIWLGSVLGVSDFFHGELRQLVLGSDDNSAYFEGDNIIEDSDVRLGYCQLGYYYKVLTGEEPESYDGVCTQCPDRCNSGSCYIESTVEDMCDGSLVIDANNYDCYSTSAQTNGDDDYVTCTECWPHAHVFHGACRCNSGYSGAPNACRLVCNDSNCESCYQKSSEGDQICVKCNDGYKMNANGTCSACNNFFGELDGSCTRDNQVAYYADYCQCEREEYYSPYDACCMPCPEGCGSCERLSSGLITCQSCLDAFFLDQINGRCVDRCPVGFDYPAGGKCVPHSDGVTFIAVNFVGGTDVYTQTPPTTEKTVKVYGGSAEKSGQWCDPKITMDRGAWFDGTNDYMTFENLRLTSAFTFRMWIRTHGEGTLFSSSNLVDDKSAERFFALYIDHSTLTFTDQETGIYFEAAQRIKKYWWHCVIMDLNLNLGTGSTITYTIDGANESGSLPIARTLLDFDDDRKSHRLGVLEFRERFENFYRGYMYSFEATYGVSDLDAHVVLSNDCHGSCSFCPATGDTHDSGVCLGICNWTHYYDESSNSCRHCDASCTSGCEDANPCSD